MNFIQELAKAIPIREEVDVLVVGGGTAGPAAAIAAARHGCKTLLIDQAGFLGGNLIGGATGFHGFWNIYHREPGAPKVKIVEGIPQELVDRAVKVGASLGHVEFQRSIDFNSVFTGLEPERTRILLYDMVSESGAAVLLHVMAVDAWTQADRHVVIIESKAGREAILARQVIDCTGDGDIAARLGVPHENYTGEKAWATSLTFRVANMLLDKALPWAEEHGSVTQIAMAQKIGGIQPEIIRFSVTWQGEMAEVLRQQGLGTWLACTSICRNDATYCNCNFRKYENNLDPADLTQSEVILRKWGQAYADTLRQHIPGCEDCYVSSHSPTLGVRLSRIFDTEYEIPRSDVLDGVHHKDTIGFISFVDQSDFWIKNAGCFGMPYRAIVPLLVDNLLLAGRMISKDNVVFQTTRNTVPSMEQGQAAGTAAALCIQNHTTPRRLDPQLLREALRQDGVKVDCPELDQTRG
jgi:hypothetical protein